MKDKFEIDMSIGTERANVINDVAEELGRVMRNHLEHATRCCPNCYHWIETHEKCDLAHTRPPARIIAFGCERYEERIPF